MARRYSKSNDGFYHSKEWQAVRQHVLDRDGYICQVCKRGGRITPATTVHHIKPVRVDSKMALSLENLETICKACHNAEHTERAQSLHKKQEKIHASRSKATVIFKNNPEIW